MRVVLAEDQELIRDGLSRLLERLPGVTVIGTASTGEEALAVTLSLQPDIAVMDIGMPGLTGIEVTAALRSQAPNIKVLILSAFDDEATILRAIKAGAAGYLLKASANLEQMTAALACLEQGGAFFSPSITALMAKWLRESAIGPADPLAGLSLRQRQILKLLGAGHSTKEIAFELELGRSTVETHRAALMKKLGLRDTAEVIRFAMAAGLVADPPRRPA